MTAFERGDIILVSYPTNDDLEMHLRPAMVLHSAHPNDAGVAVAPISPAPSESHLSLHVPHGSFEAARCGLVTAGYITACEEITVPREFVVKRLGRCPWQLLGQFTEMMRRPHRKRSVAKEPERVAVAESLVREAV